MICSLGGGGPGLLNFSARHFSVSSQRPTPPSSSTFFHWWRQRAVVASSVITARDGSSGGAGGARAPYRWKSLNLFLDPSLITANVVAGQPKSYLSLPPLCVWKIFYRFGWISPFAFLRDTMGVEPSSKTELTDHRFVHSTDIFSVNLSSSFSWIIGWVANLGPLPHIVYRHHIFCYEFGTLDHLSQLCFLSWPIKLHSACKVQFNSI
jgi:hypothetical protein